MRSSGPADVCMSRRELEACLPETVNAAVAGRCATCCAMVPGLMMPASNQAALAAGLPR